MKYVKMLGLLAVAAAAFMAFAGTASADEVTVNGATYDGNIVAEESPAGSHVTLTGPLGIKVQCESLVEGDIEVHGAGSHVAGEIDKLEFPNCTNNYKVTVTDPGALTAEATGGGNGTLFSTGAIVTIHTPLGFNCGYETAATHIGNLTGSTTTNAKLDIVNALIPRKFHSSLCGATGTWNGSYVVTSPANAVIDDN